MPDLISQILAEEDDDERIERMYYEVWSNVPKAQSRKIKTAADSALWDQFAAERDVEQAGLNRTPMLFTKSELGDDWD